MFTGIVAAVGRIMAVRPVVKGIRLGIETGDLDMKDIAVGDSIAVNGCCLTAVTVNAGGFDADVSQESLDCTTGLDRAGPVNLEKSLRLADRLGGHLVSGHVDGVGEVVRFEAVGESCLLAVRAPAELARYIARKGSICVQGVSLTINRVDGELFEINLIPHTLAVTTLQTLRAGARVNLEVDMIARYVERMMQGGS
jgi:riboflavin synthase